MMGFDFWGQVIEASYCFFWSLALGEASRHVVKIPKQPYGEIPMAGYWGFLPTATWGSHFGSRSSSFNQAFRGYRPSQCLKCNLMRASEMEPCSKATLYQELWKFPKVRRHKKLQNGSWQGHQEVLFCLHIFLKRELVTKSKNQVIPIANLNFQHPLKNQKHFYSCRLRAGQDPVAHAPFTRGARDVSALHQHTVCLQLSLSPAGAHLWTLPAGPRSL